MNTYEEIGKRHSRQNWYNFKSVPMLKALSSCSFNARLLFGHTNTHNFLPAKMRSSFCGTIAVQCIHRDRSFTIQRIMCTILFKQLKRIHKILKLKQLLTTTTKKLSTQTNFNCLLLTTKSLKIMNDMLRVIYKIQHNQNAYFQYSCGLLQKIGVTPKY